MTNREKFRDELDNMLSVFLAVVNGKPVPCEDTDCRECDFKGRCTEREDAVLDWLNAEYQEPSVDWSKVPIDTPVMVRGRDTGADWIKRHFAGIDENGFLLAFTGGGTSWSTEGKAPWKYMRLAEEKEMEARSGELWRYAAGTVEREGVVVGTDDIVVTLLPLLDICYDGAVEVVTSEGVKYVQPLRLSYTTQKKLVAYLRDVPDGTMHEIKTAISAGLGLTPAEPSRVETTVPDAGARDEAERFKAENQRLKSELIESTVRAKVMTEQYNTLLERFCDSLR